MNQINTNELTQRDLQVLSAMLKSYISNCEHNICYSKDDIKQCFDRCNPEDASTFIWFKVLNDDKNWLRYIRNQKNKLAEIQRKIKRKIANG